MGLVSSLMDVLCPGAKTLQRVEELYVHGTTGSSFDQGVLVDGERVPAHVTSVTHLPFAEPIKQVSFMLSLVYVG